MITGIVTPGREGTVPVAVFGAAGSEIQVSAVIDTGFNGFLTLPPPMVADLGLVAIATTRVILGDGSAVELGIFAAHVSWDGEAREITVLAADGAALVGMALLDGYRLTMDVVVGGTITITRLS